uniref:Uncharacterized protein n=2 Tax=Schistocephalus solidus TaxID=70667 RepID=A0A0X3NSC6_SCHSO
MDGAEPVSSSGVSALSERLVGVVAPKLATAAAYKDRLSPSESQAQRPNGSSSSAVTVGADAHPMLPSAAVTVLPAKTQATCQELTKAMNADESMEEKLQAGSRRRTPTSLSASGGNLSPTVLSNALVGGSAGSRPISLTHVATRDDVRGGGDGSSAMSNSTDNCSVLRAVVELLPAGGCRLINRHPASARAESISISVGSSSFGSLDQGDALSGGDQFWTPDPPSSPTTASNAPASPNAGCGASAASSTTSSSVSSQFFHQNVSGQQNASTSPGSSPLGESGPPTGTFDKSQQHHQNKQRLSAAPIR